MGPLRMALFSIMNARMPGNAILSRTIGMIGGAAGDGAADYGGGEVLLLRHQGEMGRLRMELFSTMNAGMPGNGMLSRTIG